MKPEKSFWQRIGIQDWFLKNEETASGNQAASLTPNDIYSYIIEKFKESIGELSFANRIVFYHEYIICFNGEDYKEFQENKKGLFGLIIQESLKKFYEILKQYGSEGKTVEPSSSKWVFRFVSHPDYQKGDKGFIGKLLPGSNRKEENLRVTYIPRQTGIAQTFDINPDILEGFTFYSEGYYEVPFIENLKYEKKNVSGGVLDSLARFETIIPDAAYAGRKVEYFMKDEEIVVSGSDETLEGSNIFKVPSEWVSTPHLRIRFNKHDRKFYLASFGEKTILNEKEVLSSDINSPAWVDLPINSKILLNGIIGINIYKS